MTYRTLIALAAGGSAALLAGAYISQVFGWAPCAMCLWQRWPHWAAVAVGAAALALPASAWLPLAGAAAAAATSGLGVYHSGVERGWWEGPSSCTGGGGLQGLSGDALLPGLAEGPALVLCDQFTPFFLGLTMANWNAILSAGLVLVWVAAAMAPRARAGGG